MWLVFLALSALMLYVIKHAGRPTNRNRNNRHY